MNPQSYPLGWNAERVQRLMAHYEAMDEEQQVAEDEAAQERQDQTTVVVPVEFMPAIRQMLAQKSNT